MKKKKRKKRRRIAISVIVLCAAALIFFAFRHSLMFFNPQHQNHLTNNALETFRINRIINENRHKTFGMDISHYQPKEAIDWDKLTLGADSIPLRFVIFRATMGSSADKYFSHFWKKAKQKNLICGAYHYYRPSENPVNQANTFINQINLQTGDLRPILDIEKLPHRTPSEQLINNLQTWLRLVEQAYGAKPIIYSYYYFYKDYLRGRFDDYPLWLANYNDVSQPSDEDKWQIWQFTENGIVNGVNVKVDLNIYNGSPAELKTLTLK